MDVKKFISQYDLIYETPPVSWKDGMLLGNGSMGAVFFAPESLKWIVNKNDVIDGRSAKIKQIIPPDEAEKMVSDGKKASDFNDIERGEPAPSGVGPKTCCVINMDVGMSSGAGTRSAIPNVNSRLSLYDATLLVDIDKHLCHPRLESFVKHDEDILIIKATDISPFVSSRTRIFFSRPEDIELGEHTLSIDKRRILMRMSMPESAGYVVGMEVLPRKSIAYRGSLLNNIRKQYHPPETGSVQMDISGRYGILTVGGDFELFLTVVTENDSDNPVAEVHRRLDKAVRAGVSELKEEHCRGWVDFWNKSTITLGDKPLEQLFYHSLYTLGSTYKKPPLPGLLGLSFGPDVGPLQISPWNGDLHSDLNVQCPFFGVHSLNHSELFTPYMQTFNSFLPEARRLAKEIWHTGGAHFDMCFNINGKSLAGGVGTYRFFLGGSYIGLMYCLAWKYRRNRKELEDLIYPFLKEVIEFYINIMKKGPDGKYHMKPAHAPELNIMNCADPVQTVSMLKMCIETAIEAAKILGEKDKDLREQWADLLENLPSYPVGKDWKGRDVVIDGVNIPANHHVGQAGCVHPVYPCGEIDTQDSPEKLKLYNDTLDSVVDKTAEKVYADTENFHYKCIWQCFFRAMTALRLGRTKEFRETYLPMFIRVYGKNNGTFSHDAALVAPFNETEGNLENIPQDIKMEDVGEDMPTFEPWCGHNGGTTPDIRNKELSIPLIEASGDYLTMISEALLQSHKSLIRVFPAWEKDSSFSNMVAEGNIYVSSSKTGGEVDYVKLRSGREEIVSVRIESPWTADIEILTLLPGEEKILTRQGEVERTDTQQSQDIEEAKPRIVFQDKYTTLWIGKKKTP